MRLEIEVPDPPAGWEYTGEYRQPAMDEPYEVEGEAVISDGDCWQYLILRRVSRDIKGGTMPKQTIEVDESLVPAGFRAAGFGKPRAGQWYEHMGKAHQASNDFRTAERLLLEKVEPVRESRWGWACCSFSSYEAARAAYPNIPLVRADHVDGKLVAVTLEPQ